MASKTFTVFCERTDIEPCRDGMIGIFNNTPATEGKTVVVRSIRCLPPAPMNPDLTNVTGNGGIIMLDRITAYTGGSERAFYPHDTSASALPSQVKLMSMPDTVTSDVTLRRIADVSATGTIITAIPFQALWRAPGVCDGLCGNARSDGHRVWQKPKQSETERFILREGYGLAAIQDTSGQPQSHHWAFTVQVTATGKTYRRTMASAGTPGNIGSPIWSLFNGSGSGVVIEVAIVNFPDFGESNIPRYRLARIDGLWWRSGDTPATITPSKHDTSLDLTGINCYASGFVASCEGNDRGVNLDYLNYQGTEMTVARQQKVGVFRHYLGSDPKYSLTHIPQMRVKGDDLVWNRRVDGISIPPGSGFAVLAGGNGLVETSEAAYAQYEIICELLAPSSSAVYPIENDVRDNVNYGPTGADYNGDLISPAVGDVKLGVGYGADGTEYTGTYSPGGGATGVSRARVVNDK